MHEPNPARSCVIIVPTIPMKAQWEDELKASGIHNCFVYVINSITLNDIKLSCDLLVLDEIHKYASDMFYKVFDLIQYRWILGLTATLNRLDGKHDLLEQKCPIIATITQEEAVAKGYISEFKEYNLALELTDVDKGKLKHINSNFHKHFGFFGHDFPAAMSCLTKKGAETYASTYKLDSKIVSYNALRFNYYMMARKSFLYKAQCKLDATVKIIQKLGLKTITFSQSTEFANDLTDLMPNKSVSYHSKIEHRIIDRSGLIIAKPVTIKVNDKDKLVYRILLTGKLFPLDELKKQFPGCKKLGIKKLKELYLRNYALGLHNISVINTAQALDQGFNVEDVELAIVASSTTNPTQHTQRTGRVVRKYTYPDGTVKKPVVVNLYIKNSQDEKWLKERQTDPKTKKPLNSNIIWIDSIDDILI